MFRLLIVDDEPLIREGLRSGFDWKKVGFEICATACDGIQALALIEQHRPDVVLTDITMAKMDGIALLKAISEQKRPIKTIVLSGYDHFEFAQKSMEYGASYYLLKPLEDEEVYSLFGKIREELEQKAVAARLEEHISRSIPQTKDVLLEKTLLLYLNGQDQTEDSLRFLLEHYGYCVEKSAFSLIELSCSREQYNKALESGLRDYCACVWQNSALPCAYRGGMLLLLFLQGAEVTLQAERMVADFLRHCDSREAPPHSAALRILMARPVCKLSALPGIFCKLIPNDNQSFYMEYGKIYPIHEPISPSPLAPVPQQDLAAELSDYIARQTPQLLRLALRQYFQTMAREEPYRELAVAKTTEIYCKVAETLKNRQEALHILSFEQLYQHLSDCCSFQELTECFKMVLDELSADFCRLISDDAGIVGDIQDYIQQHYDQKCSLSELAHRFYLHPTYLSALFCQKTGGTLSAYLKDLRMRRAKQLLRDTKCSVLEISKSVGYSDYRYFCNLFKETFQQTPMQYRTANRSSAKSRL